MCLYREGPVAYGGAAKRKDVETQYVPEHTAAKEGVLHKGGDVSKINTELYTVHGWLDVFTQCPPGSVKSSALYRE